MSSINKNIVRGILIISYVGIITIVVFGISALYSYFNTGADRAHMLHTELVIEQSYQPKVIWSPLQNKGREMDKETLKNIEKDYLNAWYVQQVAFKNNSGEGIEDYYTKKARQNIYNTINHNISEKVNITGTTVTHHPNLDFFSEDGQLAVITDRDVVEYKRVFRSGQFLFETTEIATYKIVLLLEDGFWRIRHKIREHTKTLEEPFQTIDATNLAIRGVNYYPQANPWNMFGDRFDLQTLSKDFDMIKEAGLNTIRIFIGYEDFGKADVPLEKLEKLKALLDVAEEKQLGVVVTLFDFYGDYSVLDWTVTHRHAEMIVTTFKDHNAIVAWDVKNEPDLDFESRGKSLVNAWLTKMIRIIKFIDKKHPVTIGWSNTKSAILLSKEVDFVSFHYYKDLDQLENAIVSLRANIIAKPIVMGEFGMSSNRGFWNPFGNSISDQAAYHKKAQSIIATHKLQYMSWTLYDFDVIPKEVFGRSPWLKNSQKQFGFVKSNGELKESFQYISSQ